MSIQVGGVQQSVIGDRVCCSYFIGDQQHEHIGKLLAIDTQFFVLLLDTGSISRFSFDLKSLSVRHVLQAMAHK